MAVYVFRGADPVLVNDALGAQVRTCIGDRDRALVLEEFDGDYVLAAVFEAARTPSFLGDERVIVAHDVAQHKAELGLLIEYLESNQSDADLLLEWGSTTIDAKLTKALKGAGAIMIDPSPPTKFAERRDWWREQIAAVDMDLDPRAEALVAEWLGEDVSRWPRLAQSVKAAYGDVRITPDMLGPFLGVRGDGKPWDLTDAIDGGDARKSVVAVRRLMDAGERHPLQILAQLHHHYARLGRLDGREVDSREQAETILGLKGYPAEKALKSYRAVGGEGIRKAFELLATADLDLRGGTGLGEGIVMDVLVARLARLTRSVSRRS